MRVGGDGTYRCPVCKDVFRFRDQAAPPQSPQPATQESNEDLPTCERCGQRASTGICRECGYFVCDQCSSRDETGSPLCRQHSLEHRPLELLKNLFLRPGHAYGQITPKSELLNQAILLGVVIGVLQVVVLSVYELFMPSLFSDFMQTLVSGLFSNTDFDMTMDSVGVLNTILFAPFSVLIGLFFQVLVLHVCFRLVGSGKGGFTATIKLVFYSQVAAVFCLVPWVGAILSGMYQLFLLIVGGARLHRTTALRSSIAVLLPLILLAIIGTLLFFSLDFVIHDFMPSPQTGGTII